MPRRTRTKRERKRAERQQQAQEKQIRQLERELHEQWSEEGRDIAPDQVGDGADQDNEPPKTTNT